VSRRTKQGCFVYDNVDEASLLRRQGTAKCPLLPRSAVGDFVTLGRSRIHIRRSRSTKSRTLGRESDGQHHVHPHPPLAPRRRDSRQPKASSSQTRRFLHPGRVEVE